MKTGVEKRTLKIEGLKVRNRRDGSSGVVAEGYASIFNTRTLVEGEFEGPFYEEIAPGAFTETLSNGEDIRCLYNHNWDYPLGRVSAKTLSLNQDSKGLYFECDFPSTSYAHDLEESMKRGDVGECSFTFVPEGDEWDFSGDIPSVRRLSVKLYEVSIVTLPQYEAATVSLRSMQQLKQFNKQQDIQEKIVRKKIKLEIERGKTL